MLCALLIKSTKDCGMYLKKLKIRNFRCFPQYEVELAPRVTVLFGKNGTGKTTLIHAIHKALSFMMYSERIKEKDPETGKRKTVWSKSVIKGNPYLHVEGYTKQGDVYDINDPLVEIDAVAQLDNTIPPLFWAISAYSDKLVLRYSEFREAFREFYQWHQETDELPLLCFISDSFPHKEDLQHRLLKQKISDYRSFGYYNWNGESGNTKEWVGRLENEMREADRIERKIRILEHMARNLSVHGESDNDAYKDLMRGIEVEKEKIKVYEAEITIIENVLRRFTRQLLVEGGQYLEVASLGLHPEDDKLCVNTTKGEVKRFRNLPAGYKRLFCIVLELAFRSYLLNPQSGTDSKGVAIIDEIDLHLHPELEKVALTRLVETFPNLQFIVSTHSPMVLSGLNTSNGENVILQLVSNQPMPYKCPDVYGLDYNSVVQEIMNVGASDPELQHLISRCAYLYKNNFVEQGNALKQQMIERGLLSQAALEQRIEKAMRDLM